MAAVDCPTGVVAVRPGGDASGRSNAAAFPQDVDDPDTTDNRGTAGHAATARADVAATRVAGQTLVHVVTASNLTNGLSDALLPALP